MGGPQVSKARGVNSEVEEWSFYLNASKHFEELERDVTSYETSHPNWISRARLRWWKRKTGRRRVHAVLDREVPGPTCPLLRKRRHVMPS
eukprot:4892587-Amphidinium_carterae.1